MYQFRQKSFLGFALIWFHQNQVLLPVKKQQQKHTQNAKPDKYFNELL